MCTLWGHRLCAKEVGTTIPTMSTSPQQCTVLCVYYQGALEGALVIAGWDAECGGQVYGCPIGGTLSKEKWAIDGSGSTFIWGFCDASYRWGGAVTGMSGCADGR